MKLVEEIGNCDFKPMFVMSTIQELYRVFQLLNKKFFDDKLEYPVLIIQSKKRKRSLGTCSVSRVWLKKSADDQSKYEITISAEHLGDPIEEIIDTLLHEMVHLYCALNGIKDTSNNYVYHNKLFKAECELRGMIVERGPSVGWAYTKLTEPTKELIKTFNVDEKQFEYYRKSFGPALVPDEKPTSTRTKYICETCGHKITLGKQLNIICGDCKQPFKIVTEKPSGE